MNPYCPIDNCDCPHWCEDGSCDLGDKETMVSECDDVFAYLLGESEE